MSGWLHALSNSLSILGVTQGLVVDEAGAQLLQALQAWQHELVSDSTRFSRAEWRHWLAQQLDGYTFRDFGIDSPCYSRIWLAHAGAVSMRCCYWGADALHLPGTENGSVWFNDAVRATLGLPDTRSAPCAAA
ncbi:MAG: hypothetical protein WDM70_05985 [Nitrosomonadales bacterium]